MSAERKTASRRSTQKAAPSPQEDCARYRFPLLHPKAAPKPEERNANMSNVNNMNDTTSKGDNMNSMNNMAILTSTAIPSSGVTMSNTASASSAATPRCEDSASNALAPWCRDGAPAPSSKGSTGNASAFEDFCKNINSLCAQMQDAKEEIDSSEARRALKYAEAMPISSAEDVLLFCASINLMNTYVKQGENKKSFGYFFKSYVPRLIEQLETTPIEGVVCNTSMDKNSPVTMVVICGVQFSFHCVKGAKRWIDGTEMPFDGIRKQKCAGTLFRMAEATSLLQSNRNKANQLLLLGREAAVLQAG